MTSTPSWTEFELRQLALAIEFEGWIGIARGAHASCAFKVQHNPTISVRVSVEDQIIVGNLQRLSRLGCVRLYGSPYGGTASWRVTGRTAKLLAQAIEPFAICKAEQCRLLMAFPMTTTKVPQVTSQIFAQREAATERIRELNATGPSNDVTLRQTPEAEERAHQWEEWIENSATADQRARLFAQSIDLEGCFSAKRSRNPSFRSGLHHAVTVQFGQVQRRRALFLVLSALFGEEGVHTYTSIQRDSRHDQECTWFTSGPRAVRIARQVAPFIVVKRQQAQLISEFPLRPAGGGKRISPAEFQKREEIYWEMKRLNARRTRIIPPAVAPASMHENIPFLQTAPPGPSPA